MLRRRLGAEILRYIIFLFSPPPFRKKKNQERKTSREKARESWRFLHENGGMPERDALRERSPSGRDSEGKKASRMNLEEKVEPQKDQKTVTATQ